MSFLTRVITTAIIFGGFFLTPNLNLNAQISNVSPSPTPNPISSANDTILTAPMGVRADDPLPLSMDEAIRKALENNNSIEIAKSDVRLEETRLRSLEGVYDLNLTATPNITRNADNGSGSSTVFSVDLGASKLFKSGGRIEPFFSNRRSTAIFTNTGFGTATTATTDSGAFYNSSLGVSFTQPLFRNRRIDSTRRNIRIQRKILQQKDADFRRTAIDIISQVQRAYWDLVFAMRDRQNKIANLNLTRESLRIVEAKISAGTAAPLERAEVATELANRESELLISTQNIAVADNNLKQLLIKNPESDEWQKQIVPTDKPNSDLPSFSMENALAEARANRPELRRNRLQSEINKIDLEFFKDQIKPAVDFTSSISLNGISQSFGGNTNSSITTPLLTSASDLYLLSAINAIRPIGIPEVTNPTVTIPTNNNSSISSGGYFRSFGNIFTNAPAFSVGVSINFPVGNRTARANYAGAKIQEEQIAAQTRLQEQAVISEVRNAVQAVETARLRVLTSRRSRENAEIQLQGEQKLYEVGRSTTFLLFQRENALAAARNAEIRAETDYNKAINDLQRATSTTLLVNNVEIIPQENDK